MECSTTELRQRNTWHRLAWDRGRCNRSNAEKGKVLSLYQRAIRDNNTTIDEVASYRSSLRNAAPVTVILPGTLTEQIPRIFHGSVCNFVLCSVELCSF